MSQGSRPDRVAEQIRAELALLIAREVHDPGIGFITLTRVQVTPDLQQARVFYTALGDEKSRANTARALGRAATFLRRHAEAASGCGCDGCDRNVASAPPVTGKPPGEGAPLVFHPRRKR